MFEVKTLAVLFPPYPREMKTTTRNLNLPPFWLLFVSMEMVQPIPTHALSHARGLRTFARNFSNIDFFLKILPLKDDELAMSEM